MRGRHIGMAWLARTGHPRCAYVAATAPGQTSGNGYGY
jgi:hypothetical protein